MVDLLPLKKLKNKLRSLDPYEFEEWVANVWEELGYETHIRSGSHDRGVDIVAQSESNNTLKLIQAKKYSESNKVSSQEIRRYATLYQQRPDADEVIVVTTSSFTEPAADLAEDLDIKIFDIKDLWNVGQKLDSDSVNRTVSEQVESAEEVNIKVDTIPAYKLKIRGALCNMTVKLGDVYEWNDITFEITSIRPDPGNEEVMITSATNIRFIDPN